MELIQLVFCFSDSVLTHHHHLLSCWTTASGKNTAALRCNCMPIGCYSHNYRNCILLDISRKRGTLDMLPHFD